MITIGLMVTPGSGYRSAELSEGATVADLIHAESLHSRDITVDGVLVAVADYGTTSLSSGQEVWATGAVKGA